MARSYPPPSHRRPTRSVLQPEIGAAPAEVTATAGQDPVSFWRSQLERQSPAEQPPAVSRVQRLAIILAVAAVVGAALIIVIVPMIERQLA